MSNDSNKLFNQLNITSIDVPIISTRFYKKSLYVQMNVQSWVLVSSTNIDKYRGFLFEVSQINTSCLEKFVYTISDLFSFSMQKVPTVRLASKFPIIYHPHFTEMQFSKWVEPNVSTKCDNLGHYILKIANSLQYRDTYISRQGEIANPDALDWYLKNLNKIKFFPSDDLKLPSLKSFKTQVPKFPEQPKKFELTEQMTTSINSPEINTQQSSSSIPVSKPKKKFEIVEEVTPAYSPVEKLKPSFHIVENLSSDFRSKKEENGHVLYLAKQAFEGISTHIDWGTSTSINRVEQGGILLGHSYIEPQTKQLFCIAEQSVAGKLAKGSGAYLEMTHETWKDMLDTVDNLHPELQIVGWYHTHPNGLDVFMSGTDRATQAGTFGKDWQFAIVLNPHKEIWCSFYGANSNECRGYIIDFDNLTDNSNGSLDNTEKSANDSDK